MPAFAKPTGITRSLLRITRRLNDFTRTVGSKLARAKTSGLPQIDIRENFSVGAKAKEPFI